MTRVAQAELNERANNIAWGRYEKQGRRLEHEAASRGRVESRMGDLQAKISSTDAASHERLRQAEAFASAREDRIDQSQQQAIRHALQKQTLTNSMKLMQANASKKSSLLKLELPPHIRRNVQDERLKEVLGRLDPDGSGVLKLITMGRVLTQGQDLAPPTRHRGLGHSASAPTFKPARKGAGLARLTAAFEQADTDGSGSISKRELNRVLEQAGVNRAADKLKVFKGFDHDEDGTLTFEEFKGIAKALLAQKG